MCKYDDVLDKYNKIWDKIKNKPSIKFHSASVYDEKYIKTKVKEFVSVIKTNFLGNKIPKENKHYTCIVYVTIDSVMRMKNKHYSHVFLEECKYKIKKAKISKFINTELESGSVLESETESKPDAELMANLKSKFDSHSEYFFTLNLLCLLDFKQVSFYDLK